jgi:uncharacterized membrane protein
MERMLVAIFASDARAYEASRALQGLEEQGVVAVRTDSVVTRDFDGVIKVVKLHDLAPEGALGFTAVGSFLGLLGGPAGMAVGAATGFLIGATTALAGARVGKDFVNEVAHALVPGKTALVADIDEESTEAVDARMEALGGQVFRRALTDVADSAYEHEADAIEADLAQAEAEYAASRADRKARLKARVDSLRATLRQKVADRP